MFQLLQVKTAALMLLTLKAAGSNDNLEDVRSAGTALVLSDEMLQLGEEACRADMKNQLAGTAPQNTSVSDVFVKSSQHLLYELETQESLLETCSTFLKQVGLFAGHVTATVSCQPSAVASSQPKLPKVFAKVQTFVKSTAAVTSLYGPLMRAMVSLNGRSAVEGDTSGALIQSHLLGLQTRFQEKLDTAAGSAMANFAVVIPFVLEDMRRRSEMSAKQQAPQLGLALGLNQLEKDILARYASACHACHEHS